MEDIGDNSCKFQGSRRDKFTKKMTNDKKNNFILDQGFDIR